MRFSRFQPSQIDIHANFLRTCKIYATSNSLPLSTWFHYHLNIDTDTGRRTKGNSSITVAWPPKVCACCGLMYSRSRSFPRIKPKLTTDHCSMKTSVTNPTISRTRVAGLSTVNSSIKNSSHSHTIRTVQRVNSIVLKCRICGWVESAEGRRRCVKKTAKSRKLSLGQKISSRTPDICSTEAGQNPASISATHGSVETAASKSLLPSRTLHFTRASSKRKTEQGSKPPQSTLQVGKTKLPTNSKKIFQKLNKTKLKALLNPSLQPAASSLQSFLKSVL